MGNWGIKHIAILLLVCLSHPLMAQPAEGGAQGAGGLRDAIYEFGLHVGNLLPNQIDGVTEIMGLGGVRGAFRFDTGSYFEAGFLTGNGEGQEWKNIHVDARMDVPIENLTALAYGGADMVYYKGQGRATKLVFGGHAGGGVQAPLSGMAWFRADMKFSFSPGTSLYFGVGLIWRI